MAMERIQSFRGFKYSCERWIWVIARFPFTCEGINSLSQYCTATVNIYRFIPAFKIAGTLWNLKTSMKKLKIRTWDVNLEIKNKQEDIHLSGKRKGQKYTPVCEKLLGHWEFCPWVGRLRICLYQSHLGQRQLKIWLSLLLLILMCSPRNVCHLQARKKEREGKKPESINSNRRNSWILSTPQVISSHRLIEVGWISLLRDGLPTTKTAQQRAVSLLLAVHCGLLWTRRKINKTGCNGGTSYIIVTTHVHKKRQIASLPSSFILLAANFLHTYIMHAWVITYRSYFPFCISTFLTVFLNLKLNF